MDIDLLFATPQLPHPPHGGAAKRIRNILEGLHERGYRIHLVAGAEDNDRKAAGVLKEFCEELHLFREAPIDEWRWLRSLLTTRPYPAGQFSTPEYRATVQEVCETEEIDIAWVNFIFMLEPFDAHDSFPIALDQHEVQHDVWADYLSSGGLLEKAFALQNLVKLRRWEPRYLSAANAIASVSPEERETTMDRLADGIDVWTVPNGVDVDAFEPLSPPEQAFEIIFVGGMGVKRNADAVRWFVQEIFPRIREIKPKAHFSIVGSDPLPEVRALEEYPGVTVTGTVPDVRPYYKDADVVVIPQRFGAGTKLKALEAMAVGRPVVTTSNGVQGIDVEHETHVRIADAPEAFARNVVELLDDPVRGRELAKRARVMVVERYAWSSIVDDLGRKLRSLVQGSA